MATGLVGSAQIGLIATPLTETAPFAELAALADEAAVPVYLVDAAACKGADHPSTRPRAIGPTLVTGR